MDKPPCQICNPSPYSPPFLCQPIPQPPPSILPANPLPRSRSDDLDRRIQIGWLRMSHVIRSDSPARAPPWRPPLLGPEVSICNSSHDAITWRAENRTHLSKQTRPSTERSRKASNVRGIPSRPDDQLRWVLIVRSQV